MPPGFFIVLYADFPPASAEADTLGYRWAFKAYHQIVSVAEDNDESRSSHFLEPISPHCGTKQKPPARAGGFVQFANKVLIALP
jgi:hypothetical protein